MIIPLLVTLASVGSVSFEPAWVHDETRTIMALDERPLVFHIDRPGDGAQVPLLVMIDGSGCTGQQRPGFASLFRPGEHSPMPYARLRVEKPGVEPRAQDGATCSEDFLRAYSMTDRTLDHLRVFQHLRSRADWWNGELLIWGWSDGGDIAAQIVTYSPEVSRAVIGGVGGGYTMAEHFTDFWVCPDDQMTSDERDSCVQALNDQFEQMENNPTWAETWSGGSNSWRSWATRLHLRFTHGFEDSTTPVLFVHGALDFDGAPVESARRLIEHLDGQGQQNHEYWEIPCMGHGWSSLPSRQALQLEQSMLEWLLIPASTQPGSQQTNLIPAMEC